MYLKIFLVTVFLTVLKVNGQFRYGEENPAILYDTRASALDGSYQFEYNTQDGISHVSHSTPDKVVSGEYGYTDPTGLKVNWKYNTGTHTAANNAPSYQKTTTSRFSRPKVQQQYNNQDYYDDYDYDSRSYNQPRYSKRNEYEQFRISYTSNY